MSTVISKYNALHGRTVFYDELLDLVNEAKDEGHHEIVANLSKALYQSQNYDGFEITVENPIQEPLTADLLGAIPFLSEQEEKEFIGDDIEGLGKVSQNDIYKMVNDKLLELMEKEDLPFWKKPWKSIRLFNIPPTNFHTKNPYTGINALLLNPFSDENPYFLTFNQLEKLGGKIKKGSKAIRIVYYNFRYTFFDTKKQKRHEDYIKKNFIKSLENDEFDLDDSIYDTLNDLAEDNKFGYLKYYNVFNGNDIEGIDWELEDLKRKKEERQAKIESLKINIPEMIVEHTPTKPKIVFKNNNKPYYSPTGDYINMPKIDQFDSPPLYYSNLFHELVHWTGNYKRLNRVFGIKFGDKEYSYEEIIAELGSNYLNMEAGFDFNEIEIEQSAKYIKGFKRKVKASVKKDPRFFLRVAAKSQNAVDYILDRKQGEQAKYRIALDKQLSESNKNKSKSIEEQIKNVLLTVKSDNQTNLFYEAREQVKKQVENLPEDRGLFKNPLDELIRDVVFSYNIFKRKHSDGTIGYQELPIPKPLKGVKEDISITDAENAYMWTSFFPKKRGENSRRSYFYDLMHAYYSIYDELKDVEDKEDKIIKLDELFINFREKYKNATLNYLRSHSRVMSSMITGSAKFPVDSNRRKSDAAYKKMNKYIEIYDKELRYIQKKLGLVESSNIIVSGKDGSLELLEEKLKKLEEYQEFYKNVNKIIKKAKNDEEVKKNLQEEGVSDEIISSVLNPQFGEKKGFPSYMLTNNRQQINKLKERILEEKRFQERKEKSNQSQKEFPFEGGYVLLNYGNNRLQIFFDEKPPVEKRNQLKKTGFNWSRKEEAWQRQLTSDAVYAVNSVLKDEGVNVVQEKIALDEHERIEQEGDLVIKSYDSELDRRFVLYKVDGVYKRLFLIKNNRSQKIDKKLEPETITFDKLTKNGKQDDFDRSFDWRFSTNKQLWDEFKKQSKENHSTKDIEKKDTTENLGRLPLPTLATKKKRSEPIEYFNIQGDIGKFLGKIERKPEESVAVTLDAPQGSGKTRWFFQVMEVLAKAGYKGLFNSIEEHPESNLFQEKIDQYISEKSKKNISCISEDNFEKFKEYIPYYDFVLVDSWNKLAEKNNIDFDDDLRKAYDGKLFFCIFQRTVTGGMRGGSKAQFDGDIILKVFKDVDDFKNNYIYADKNRYSDQTGLKLNTNTGKLMKEKDDTEN